jgi:hypothetical protein
LYLVLRLRGGAGFVIVSTKDGEKISISTSQFHTTERLKELLSFETNLHTSLMILVYEGRVLQDGMFYSIQ